MPVAETAASLFFLAKDLHRLERIYIFSLSWFMELFKQELRWKPPIKEQEAQANDESFDPVQDLQKRLVTSVYRRICLSIFDEDKVLIAVMMAYQLAKKDIEDSEGSSPMKEVEIALWQFFMKGLNQRERKKAERTMTQREKDQLEYQRKMKSGLRAQLQQMTLLKACPWISLKNYEGLLMLEQLDAFRVAGHGLIEHITQNPNTWKKFVLQSLMDIEYTTFPDPFNPMKQQGKSLASLHSPTADPGAQGLRKSTDGADNRLSP
jgi:hypothetical protein